MTKLFGFSLLTVFLVWLLLIIGGLVNPMGASMACPDWYFIPTCNGELLPTMVGGVLYEHGHRLVASLVGIVTVLLAFFCYRSSGLDAVTKKMSLLAVVMVVVQGSLGGLTVLLKLSVVISTLHLVCAMAFFALLICISFRLSPHFLSYSPRAKATSWPLLLAIGLVMVQVVYGGVVRHLGAGLACGDDMLGCGPTLWPSWFYGQLHMGHRLLGYAIVVAVIYAALVSINMAKINGQRLLLWLSWMPVAVTVSQIGLGLLAIYTVRSAPILALHTGFGALLLASLLVVYLLAGRVNCASA